VRTCSLPICSVVVMAPPLVRTAGYVLAMALLSGETMMSRIPPPTPPLAMLPMMEPMSSPPPDWPSMPAACRRAAPTPTPQMQAIDLPSGPRFLSDMAAPAMLPPTAPLTRLINRLMSSMMVSFQVSVTGLLDVATTVGRGRQASNGPLVLPDGHANASRSAPRIGLRSYCRRYAVEEAPGTMSCVRRRGAV